MKPIANTIMLITGLFFSAISFSQHQLVKLWETDTLLRTPESVLLDKANNILYVSDIDGAADAKDGVGGISKVALDGKIISANWVTGLNAPKGLGLYKNTLWVADLDEVDAININTGKIEKKIPVEGAKFLNDIAVDKNGAVYVSDTRIGKVYKIENGTAATLLSDLKDPNGLYADGDDLYVLDNGSLLKMNPDKSLTKIAEGMESSTDGLEKVNEKDFLASCWVGTIYYVNADGSKQKLLDTTAEKSNTADIGFNAGKSIVYVPTFLKNKVVAYQLK
jgi:sugar lactone lactonase YvrE